MLTPGRTIVFILGLPARAQQSSGVVHRKTTHKTTRDIVSQALGGPGPEVPAYKVQSIGMRSRRLHDGLIRPEPSTHHGVLSCAGTR